MKAKLDWSSRFQRSRLLTVGGAVGSAVLGYASDYKSQLRSALARGLQPEPWQLKSSVSLALWYIRDQ